MLIVSLASSITYTWRRPWNRDCCRDHWQISNVHFSLHCKLVLWAALLFYPPSFSLAPSFLLLFFYCGTVVGTHRWSFQAWLSWEGEPCCLPESSCLSRVCEWLIQCFTLTSMTLHIVKHTKKPLYANMNAAKTLTHLSFSPDRGLSVYFKPPS